MKEQTKGFLFALFAYIIWGLFPLFFSLFKNVSVIEILAHRIIWAFFFVVGFILILSRKKEIIHALRSKNTVFCLIISTILIFSHWLNFNWLVEQHRVIDTSLGYFLFPLLFEVFIEEEKLKFSITINTIYCTKKRGEMRDMFFKKIV